MPIVETPTEDTLSCDKNVIKTVPCLACMSKTELMAVLVWMLAVNNGYSLPADTNTILKKSACMACLTEHQLLEAFITILGFELLQNETGASSISDVRKQIKCLLCANPQQLKAAIVFLACTGIQLSNEQT
jgi:hypothetical protein